MNHLNLSKTVSLTEEDRKVLRHVAEAMDMDMGAAVFLSVEMQGTIAEDAKHICKNLWLMPMRCSFALSIA